MPTRGTPCPAAKMSPCRRMKSIRLHVASDNAPAIAFYRKYGFGAINVESGMISDLLLMEKSLV